MTNAAAQPWTTPTARHPLDVSVTLPGSKSATNRALLLAALAEGPSTIHRPLRARDTELMTAALRVLGAVIQDRRPAAEPADERNPDVADDGQHPDDVDEGIEGDAGLDAFVVEPRFADLTTPARIDCGLAGTVMRFVPPAAGLTRGRVEFDGDPRARERPMAPMLDALDRLGLAVDNRTGGLPFGIDGTGSVPGGAVTLDASESSQFVSGLLLSGARYDEGVDVRHDGKPLPSQPHIDMTVAMLRERGVLVDDGDPNRWSVAPGPIKPLDVTVEPDLSNAAPFVAAPLVCGGRVTVPGWPAVTTQAGDRLRWILAAFGADVELSRNGLSVSAAGPVEAGADGREIRAVDLDLHDVGELTPVVAALAVLAEGPSRLRGISHLRGHETDRLHALATQLSACGADCRETEDGLAIRPGRLHGAPFRSRGDHRMVHAAAVLGLAVSGIEVDDPTVTTKTHPGFVEAWTAMLT